MKLTSCEPLRMHTRESATQTGAERAGEAGFTIVEIVLALGVATFSILSMLGLLSASFQISKYSSEDTLMASMVRQVAADLHQRPFDTLTTAAPSAYYFDYDAHLVTSQANAIYVCTPTVSADSSYNTGNSVNLYQIQLSVASALSSTSQRPAIQTMHIVVARHG